MKSPLLPALAGLLSVLCLLPASAAQEPAPDDMSLRKINGVFDTDLPKTEKKGRIRLIVHPHLGDFTSRSYVRIPLGVRWGVNDHVEFTAMVEP